MDRSTQFATAVSRRADPRLLAALSGDDPEVAAVALACLGFPICPVHTVSANGRCGCGNPACANVGKHPCSAHGVHDATAEVDDVHRFWRRRPDANPAIATGIVAGVWILDIDPGRGGENFLAELEAKHGELPTTWAVETGGGGLHLWFIHPGGAVPSSASKVGPGLDVRGEGGYAICPPARHRSGNRYAWAEAWQPGLVSLALAPTWLVALARGGRELIPPDSSPYGSDDQGNHGATPIPEGGRNDALTRLGGAMRRRGFGEAAIQAALLAENAARCEPPLPEAEVVRIARSVVRYAPAADLGVRVTVTRAAGFVEFVDGRAVVR